MACLETKTIMLVPLTSLKGRRYLPLPCARRKKSLEAEISQVTFSGPERRVWRDYLATVFVLITAAAVEKCGEVAGDECVW